MGEKGLQFAMREFNHDKLAGRWVQAVLSAVPG
jgi:hypothetical protein